MLIAVIAGFCFFSFSGHWTNFATHFLGAHGGFGGFMIALIAALWAYDGWNDLTMVAGEVRNPERSLPIALLAGLGIVGVLYMATNAAIQYILPAAQIAASPRPAVSALQAITGPWGAGLVSIAMAVSIIVTLNGTIMSGARVPYAAARDGLFFRRMADIHPALLRAPRRPSSCRRCLPPGSCSPSDASSSSSSWPSLPSGSST